MDQMLAMEVSAVQETEQETPVVMAIAKGIVPPVQALKQAVLYLM